MGKLLMWKIGAGSVDVQRVDDDKENIKVEVSENCDLCCMCYLIYLWLYWPTTVERDNKS